ncbi:SRPBCC family protein [Tateyamaria sp. SN3-11]|uniref:SRPBCC family protein n=1 Tax=Tateyamaria sp. SN3-11 TaxID=3092147 RepID=UPI0039EC73F9
MTQDSYERTIKTTASGAEVYAALTTGVAQWWTSDAGKFEQVGDVARFGFTGRRGYWTFKATALAQDRVEWECVEALHLHEGMPREIETEWLGTRAIWSMQETDTGTNIHFVHDGLTQDLLCFDICAAGWDMFFVDSLKTYLDTGTGKPHA